MDWILTGNIQDLEEALLKINRDSHFYVKSWWQLSKQRLRIQEMIDFYSQLLYQPVDGPSIGDTKSTDSQSNSDPYISKFYKQPALQEKSLLRIAIMQTSKAPLKNPNPTVVEALITLFWSVYYYPIYYRNLLGLWTVFWIYIRSLYIVLLCFIVRFQCSGLH